MKRRHLLALAAMPSIAAAAPPRFLHVGTYAPAGQGIHSFGIEADGRLRPLGVTPNPQSPSWLEAHGGFVYAAEEGGDHIAVYAADDGGRLALVQRQRSEERRVGKEC